jgi:hypothetical protein
MKWCLFCLVFTPGLLFATPTAPVGSKQYLMHSPWSLAPQASKSHKADQTGVYDLEQISAQIDLFGNGLPTTINYDVLVRAQMDIEGAIVFYAPGFLPRLVVATKSDGRVISVDFARDDDSGELFILLDEQVRAGESLNITMTGRIDYQLICVSPVSCVAQGPYQHLATPGWYPMSNEHPANDRFHFVTSFNGRGPWMPLGIGQSANNDHLSPVFSSQSTTFLPLLTIGNYRRFDGQNGVAFFAPSDTDEVFIEDAITTALAVYEDLLGPFPYAHLRFAAISDEAAVGIGAQSQILLPETLWQVPQDDDFFRTVRQVVSHEIAHQYFFNLIGVTDAEEGWMSEGFAEYGATRVSQVVDGTQAHLRRNYWSYMTEVTQFSDAPLHGVAVRMSPDSFEIIYNKGSAVLGALRALLGGETFDAALRDYVSVFSGEITTTQEFEAFLMERTGHPMLAQFFEQWVYGKGYPTLDVRVTRDRGDSRQIRLQVAQILPAGRALPYGGALPIEIHGENGSQTHMLNLANQVHSLDLEDGQWIRIDPNYTLFRRIRPTPASDVNLTGVVDGMDLLDVNHAQGRQTSDEGFSDAVDIDNDGRVTTDDLDTLVEQFGQGWSP